MFSNFRQGKLLMHQLVLFGVLLLMTGVRWLGGVWSMNVFVLWWWIGAIIGFLFVFTDRLYYALMQHPEEVLSVKMKDLFGRRQFLQGLVLVLQERADQQKLTVRSVLFLATWVILGVFTVTSVGGAFGRGFMLGLGLHLVFDLLVDYFGKGRDVRLWFWQIKRELNPEEMVVAVWGFVILFVVIGVGL